MYREAVVADAVATLVVVGDLRRADGAVYHMRDAMRAQQVDGAGGRLVAHVDSAPSLGVSPDGVHRVPLPSTARSSIHTHTHGSKTPGHDERCV